MPSQQIQYHQSLPTIIITSPTEPAEYNYVPEVVQENLLSANYKQWCAIYSTDDSKVSLSCMLSELQEEQAQQKREQQNQRKKQQVQNLLQELLKQCQYKQLEIQEQMQLQQQNQDYYINEYNNNTSYEEANYEHNSYNRDDHNCDPYFSTLLDHHSYVNMNQYMNDSHYECKSQDQILPNQNNYDEIFDSEYDYNYDLSYEEEEDEYLENEAYDQYEDYDYTYSYSYNQIQMENMKKLVNYNRTTYSSIPIQTPQEAEIFYMDDEEEEEEKEISDNCSNLQINYRKNESSFVSNDRSKRLAFDILANAVHRRSSTTSLSSNLSPDLSSKNENKSNEVGKEDNEQIEVNHHLKRKLADVEIDQIKDSTDKDEINKINRVKTEDQNDLLENRKNDEKHMNQSSIENYLFSEQQQLRFQESKEGKKKTEKQENQISQNIYEEGLENYVEEVKEKEKVNLKKEDESLLNRSEDIYTGNINLKKDFSNENQSTEKKNKTKNHNHNHNTNNFKLPEISSLEDHKKTHYYTHKKSLSLQDNEFNCNSQNGGNNNNNILSSSLNENKFSSSILCNNYKNNYVKNILNGQEQPFQMIGNRRRAISLSQGYIKSKSKNLNRISIPPSIMKDNEASFNNTYSISTQNSSFIEVK